jgi:hypothetical protein
MKKILFSLALAAVTMASQAQNMFNHLDLGVTLGTTGIGLDAAMPVGNYVKLRTGLEVMPRFNYDMHFGVESYGEGGVPSSASLDRMSEVLYGLTGFKVDQDITMKGKPTMWNFKFLVDVYPFKNNKHWHVTAGFHWGPSKIAEAVNAQEDSPSLFAVGMYNHLYDVSYQTIVLKDPVPIISTQTTGDLYLDPMIEKKIVEFGRMGIPVGKFDDGTTYYMQPNENSMVYADAYVNSFKPYLGIGYEGRLIKGNDNYKIGFDAGLMFWGGTPDIITHDGTNLSKDVTDIQGKVGRYVDFVKGVKTFPVLNLRITRRIF